MANTKGQVTKWVGLAAGIWVQALAGNGYVFPNFAPALKRQLHFTQVELNNLGVAKDIGENVGLLAGMLSNLVPPWVILLIGAFEGFLAYGTLWLVMSGHIAPLPYWQLCVVLLIGANSTTCFNTAVLVTTMRNFPESRGMVVGIVKGFIGLSSAIFTQIYVAILRNNATELVLLLALGPSLVCLLVMYFIQPVKSSDETRSVDPAEKNGFIFIHIVCIGLAAYLLFATVFETFVPAVSPFTYQIVTAVMVVFLCSPLLVPARFAYHKYLIRRENRKLNNNSFPKAQLSLKIDDDLRDPLLRVEKQRSDESSPKPPVVTDKEQGAESLQQAKISSTGLRESTCTTHHPNNNNSPDTSPHSADSYSTYDTSKLTSPENRGIKKSLRGYLSLPRSEDGEVDPGTLLAVGEGALPRRRKGPRRGEDFTLLEALVKADFWLLFCTFFCGMGTGITVINNLGQIGQAQGFSDVTIFVSLLGIMNFLGRLGAGALSEHFVRSSALPRTVWMLGAQVLMMLGHLLFATAMPGSLYVGSVVLGVCYGVHVAIMVPTASELFGLRHFGMIYNFITMGNPIGSLLLSGMVAGYLYDKESDKNPSVHNIQEHILARYIRNSVSADSDSATCLGAHCFRLTFLIMAMVCVVGFILNLILTFRIRRVYQSLYRSRNPSYQNLASANVNKSSPPSPPGLSTFSPPLTIVQSGSETETNGVLPDRST